MYQILRNFAGKGVDALHRESREGDIRDSLADITLAKTLLGYNPQVRMREGLERTLASTK